MASQRIPRSRAEAKRLGSIHYFPGTECRHGHTTKRYTRSGECFECARLRLVGNPKHLARGNRWRRRNRAKVNDAARAWRQRNPERERVNRQRQYKKNGAKIRARSRRWKQKNRKRVRRWEIEYRRTNLAAKLRLSLRTRLNIAIRRGYRAGSAVRDLGCTIVELRAYIEARFTGRMRWSNWGSVWELDHVRPLADFDLTKRAEFLRACHFRNLQPLTIGAHRIKTALQLAA